MGCRPLQKALHELLVSTFPCLSQDAHSKELTLLNLLLLLPPNVVLFLMEMIPETPGDAWSAGVWMELG